MSVSNGIQYDSFQPGKQLSGFIQYYWHLQNHSAEKKTVTILPDGYFDILFFHQSDGAMVAYLSGLQTKPVEYSIPVNASTYAISFKLPAAEYLLKTSLSLLVNKGMYLTNNSWIPDPAGFTGIRHFARQVTKKILPALQQNIDPRKQQLFEHLYAAGGNITIEQIADTVYWSRRQINRYFKNWFGISLKEYCNILRYRASFEHISGGQLYPEQNYYDQAHFIKEIKKYSGVTPKHLAQNKNDRFIQFATLPKG